MILQHCVLSSYHAILTGLSKDQWVTSYALENKIKMCGIYSLYKKGKIFFDDKGMGYKDSQKDSTNEDSGRASSFSRKISSHFNRIPAAMDFFTEQTGEISYGIRLQFSEICYSICGVNAGGFDLLKNGEWEKRSSDTILDSIERLTCNLEPRIGPFGDPFGKSFRDVTGNVVDSLYHYYITERIFNLSLFYNLLSNIYDIESQTYYRLSPASIIDILVCCKDLPNTFSRQYFLKYALDKIIDEPDSHMDFWRVQDMKTNGVMIGVDQTNEKDFSFSSWQKQYKLFVGYMSKFVIPVYEWCFINMLLEAIEKKFPDKDHIFHLKQAFELLSGYMEDNYKTILRPVDIGKGMDLVDMISTHEKFEVLKIFSNECIQQVAECLFSFTANSGEDRELNLHLLDPGFFDDTNAHHFSSNLRKIRAHRG